MRFAHYESGSATGWGVVLDDEIAPLPPSAKLAQMASGIAALDADERTALAGSALAASERIPVADVRLLAPVRPSKIIAIGLNYADHIAESGMQAPEVPTVFAKFPTTVTGPYDVIHRPKVSSALDYEGELGVVIGTRCRHVPRDRVGDVVLGYVVLNDVSVRDWQTASPQWSLAKSFDTHMPVGPWLTTADEVDVSDAVVEARVNGELRQQSSTRNLVFDVADLVAYLSQACTLEAGDVIATGTPGGVGAAMDPPR
jgi:2-keto-4-pentenoate hydratase/2-oxohepta-3-ene-1,7-dioic acid hydratase in catechol pathway